MRYVGFKIQTLTGLALVMASACSLTGRQPSVRVSMPKQSGAQMTIQGASTASVAPGAPASYSGFNCFGLNVLGAGVPRSAICADDPTAGAIGGFAPFSGGTVSVKLPPGANRRVQLLGMVSSDGSCPSIADLDSSNGPAISTFLLGETTTDVFSDVTVTIQANYTNAASAVEVLSQCGSGPHGVLPPDVSGLVGWYDLSEETSDPILTFLDYSGHNYDLTTGNGPALVAAPSGIGGMASGNFVSGSSNYLEAPVALGVMGSATGYTAMAVISMPTANYFGIVSTEWGSGQAGMETNLAGNIVFKIAASQAVGPVITDSAPRLVEMIWDYSSNSIVGYVNGGNFVSTSAGGFGPTTPHVNNRIGKSGSYFMTGLISEVVIYNRAIASSERESLECYFKSSYSLPINNSICP